MNKLAEHLFRSGLSVSPRRLRVPPPRSDQLLCLRGRSLLGNSRALGKCGLSRCHVACTRSPQPSEAAGELPFPLLGQKKVFWKIPLKH